MDTPGLEHLRIAHDPAGPRLSGTILLAHDGAPMRILYDVGLSSAWETRQVSISATIGEMRSELALVRNEAGRWFRAGEELLAYDECVDVDISLTPSTNTLPIRRLGLLDAPIAESREVTALWIRFPELSIEPLPQRYTRIGARRFRYDSRGGEFTTDVEVDEEGFVVSYPPFWERVAA